MHNLSSYCGLIDLRMSASEKDLPVCGMFTLISIGSGVSHSQFWFIILLIFVQILNISSFNSKPESIQIKINKASSETLYVTT